MLVYYRMNKKNAELLKQKCGGSCAYCGVVLGDVWAKDHMEPVERYMDEHGKMKMRYPERHVFSNMMPSCASCNMYKSNLSLCRLREILNEKIIRILRNKAVIRMMNRGELRIKYPPVVFWFESMSEQTANKAPYAPVYGQNDRYHVDEVKYSWPDILKDGKTMFLIRLGYISFEVSSAGPDVLNDDWRGTLFE